MAIIFIPLLLFLVAAGFFGFKIKRAIDAERAALEESGVEFSSSGSGSGSDECDTRGTSVRLPSDWPSDVPLYPGGELISATRYGGGPNGSQSSASFCTDASHGTVVDYFNSAVSSWNIDTVGSDSTSDAGGISERTLFSGTNDQPGLARALVIIIETKDGQTKIDMTVTITSSQ